MLYRRAEGGGGGRQGLWEPEQSGEAGAVWEAEQSGEAGAVWEPGLLEVQLAGGFKRVLRSPSSVCRSLRSGG